MAGSVNEETYSGKSNGTFLNFKDTSDKSDMVVSNSPNNKTFTEAGTSRRNDLFFEAVTNKSFEEGSWWCIERYLRAY